MSFFYRLRRFASGYNYQRMAKGLCIVNGYSSLRGPLHFYERMKEELEKKNVGLSLVKSTAFLSSINENGAIEILPGMFSFVLFLDKDAYLAAALERQGYHLFNSAEAIRLSDDKMLTSLTLAGHGIKMPKTIGAPLNYVGGSDEGFLKLIAKGLSFPIVGKCSYGSLGKEVELLENEEQLKAFEEKNACKSHLYQQFIESSKGIDYRLIVIGNKFVAGMRRHNETDFRSNLAQGGKGEKAEIPAGYVYLAEKASRLLGLDYAGVDILRGSQGEPVLSEVNSNAFLDGIESTTGINVAEAYAKYIVKALGLQ